MLWDKQNKTIVNNESSEIIRIFNTAFNDVLPEEYAKVDLYPEQHRAEIDEIGAWVYDTVNSTFFCHLVRQDLMFDGAIVDGVYRAGFATSQEAYEKAVRALFNSLDKLEGMLKGQDYLVGGVLTEADVRLFVTIVSSPIGNVMYAHFATDPLRPRLRGALQMQHSHYSRRVSGDQQMAQEALLGDRRVQGLHQL